MTLWESIWVGDSSTGLLSVHSCHNYPSINEARKLPCLVPLSLPLSLPFLSLCFFFFSLRHKGGYFFLLSIRRGAWWRIILPVEWLSKVFLHLVKIWAAVETPFRLYSICSDWAHRQRKKKKRLLKRDEEKCIATTRLIFRTSVLASCCICLSSCLVAVVINCFL